MKLIFKKAAIIFLVISSSAVTILNAQADLSNVKTNIQQRLDEGNMLGISIAYIYPDGHVKYFSEGSLSTEREQKVDKKTIFEIGSVTKTFTALILARMAGQHKLSLDDPISKFLPDSVHAPTYNGQSITLRNLATHTSGLPRMPSNFLSKDPLNPYTDYTNEDLYRFLNRYKLSKLPGSTFQYSNLGMGLLDHLLEVASQKSYPQLLREYVTSALDMSDTYVTVPEQKKNMLADPYFYDRAVSHWDFDALSGAGAIRSTAEDLDKYMKVQMGLTATYFDSALQKTHAIQFDSGSGNLDAIGLAWIHSTKHDTIIWHDGGTGGFSSFVGWNKQNQTGVVVLTNGKDDIHDIGFHLLDKRFPLKQVEQTISINQSILRRYVGTYQFSPAFSIIITKQGDQLMAQATNQQKFKIYPESNTKFFYKVVNAQLKFFPDTTMNYTILKLYQNNMVQKGKKTNENK